MKKGIKVLSLFDGMSCGRIALERAGIPVERYFSSEIDKHAITISNKNYPQDSKDRVGDVTKITPPNNHVIDLIIGGSPCQGFSFNGKQLNFKDPRSVLFFEFARLVKGIKPKYFLLENVLMNKGSEDVISGILGVKPIFINSSLVSAQNRPRIYWTNIPGACEPEDRKIKLVDILDLTIPFSRPKHTGKYKCNFPVSFKKEKFNCLRANAGCKTQGIGVMDENENWRKLTPNECEELQNVPKNYTLFPESSKLKSPRQRYKMLGNGWTVDVIAHLFNGLKKGGKI